MVVARTDVGCGTSDLLIDCNERHSFAHQWQGDLIQPLPRNSLNALEHVKRLGEIDSGHRRISCSQQCLNVVRGGLVGQERD